jgi:LemA protein
MVHQADFSTEYTMLVVCIALVFSLTLLCWIIGTRSRLLQLRNRVKSKFVHLVGAITQRHDVISEIVDNLKRATQNENRVLDDLVVLSQRATDANSRFEPYLNDVSAVPHLVELERALVSVLRQELASSNLLHTLKDNEHTEKLSSALLESEKRIVFLRHVFNESVDDYNFSLAQFPSSMVASVLCFPHANQIPEIETMVQ